MEKAIVRACVYILLGLAILFFALWQLADYTWEK